jgi:hypothetical protein
LAGHQVVRVLLSKPAVRWQNPTVADISAPQRLRMNPERSSDPLDRPDRRPISSGNSPVRMRGLIQHC